jgi:7tm Odorant receptor
MASNYISHFASPMKALKVFGFWPTKESSRKHRLWSFVSFLVFLILPFNLTLILLMKFKHFEESAINFVILYSSTIFKVLNLVYNLESVEDLMLDLKNLIEFTKSETDAIRLVLQRHVKFMVGLLVVSGIFILSVLLDLAVPFFNHRLPYPMWIPYNYDNEFIFWITAVVQVSVSIVACTVAICLKLVPVFFMGMAATILAELRDRMKLLSEDGKTDDEKYKELVKCIKIHQRIRNLVQRIENCFSITFFMEGFFSSTSICLTVYILSRVRKRVNII